MTITSVIINVAFPSATVAIPSAIKKATLYHSGYNTCHNNIEVVINVVITSDTISKVSNTIFH